MCAQKKNGLNRKIAPPIKDAVEFQLELPPYTRQVLSNGVEVYSIDMGNVDVMMINWVFDAGNWYEEKRGVAAAVNTLLKNGTSKRNAFAINEHFEYYGSYLTRSCHHETAELTMHCLSKHIRELLPVVAELVTDSIFPPEELSIYKKNAQQRLQVNLKKSEFVAGRLIDAYLYGPTHPYGKYSEGEDYQALEPEDTRGFYESFYRNGTCSIFAAGKLPDDLIRQLESFFGQGSFQAPAALSLPGEKSVKPAFPITPATQKKYNIVNDPAGVQGSIRIARNFPNRHHPDFQKAQMLNNVFGGYFGSRLMMNIREDKGYTYGIHSYLLNNVQESGLLISTEAGKEVCAATIREVYHEMQRLRDEPIGEEELQMARNHTIGGVLGDLDGPFHVIGRWKNILLNGLNKDYFNRGIEIVKTITPGELQELAKKYLDPSDFFELVVV